MIYLSPDKCLCHQKSLNKPIISYFSTTVVFHFTFWKLFPNSVFYLCQLHLNCAQVGTINQWKGNFKWITGSGEAGGGVRIWECHCHQTLPPAFFQRGPDPHSDLQSLCLLATPTANVSLLDNGWTFWSHTHVLATHSHWWPCLHVSSLHLQHYQSVAFTEWMLIPSVWSGYRIRLSVSLLDVLARPVN